MTECRTDGRGVIIRSVSAVRGRVIRRHRSAASSADAASLTRWLYSPGPQPGNRCPPAWPPRVGQAPLVIEAHNTCAHGQAHQLGFVTLRAADARTGPGKPPLGMMRSVSFH